MKKIFEYEYDKKDNWIEKIEYIIEGDERKIKEITSRDISYY